MFIYFLTYVPILFNLKIWKRAMPEGNFSDYINDQKNTDRHLAMNLFLRYGFKYRTALIVLEIINALLLLLLLYTGISKLSDHETFLFVLKKSPLLYRYAGFVAIALPIAELLVALLLFVPLTRLKGLYASFVLISLLTVYLVYMILFSPELPCNCGGVVGALSWKQHIVFNLFFIALSLCGIFLNQKNKNRRSSPPP